MVAVKIFAWLEKTRQKLPATIPNALHHTAQNAHTRLSGIPQSVVSKKSRQPNTASAHESKSEKVALTLCYPSGFGAVMFFAAPPSSSYQPLCPATAAWLVRTHYSTSFFSCCKMLLRSDNVLRPSLAAAAQSTGFIVWLTCVSPPAARIRRLIVAYGSIVCACVVRIFLLLIIAVSICFLFSS